MRLVDAARTNYRDARRLGVGVLRRHVDGLVGRPYTRAHIKRYGPVTIRPRTSDCRVLRQIFGERQYDLTDYPQNASIQAAYERILAAGRTPLIIDLGANIGASTLWYSLTYPLAHIVAVEPERSNADLCRRNTAGRDVDVMTAAVGSRPGTVDLSDAGNEKWGFITTRSRDGSTPVCLVNDIVRTVPNCTLFIVKIDIEGFEADLFADNTEWAQLATAIVIEPHDWMLPGAATSRAFQRLFGGLDNDVLIRGENLVYVRRDQAADPLPAGVVAAPS